MIFGEVDIVKIRYFHLYGLKNLSFVCIKFSSSPQKITTKFQASISKTVGEVWI